MRETLAVALARIEERVKSLTEVNSSDHKEIISNILDLKEHVNDENEKMDIRMVAVEDFCKRSLITWKVLGKVGSVTITVIGIAIALVKLILGV